VNPATGTRSKQGGANVRLPPPLVFVGLPILGLALHYLVLPLRLPMSVVARAIAGGLVGGAGLALNLATNVLFRRTGQNPLPWMPSPSLILRGPYKFSRNPMYLSVVLMMAGLGLGLGTLWLVLFAPIALIVVHYTAVLPEEAYLGAEFGEAYGKYKAAVRRYL
jgi:protein-S-isoprenylcysteine O-methyltransferase Ste14